ncbi:hypothetical protein MNBD_NITROSPIRAE03-422 [hydrothermal vent metagenome]|uniref:Polysaccharide chain length determinant N-terminal domain-containing protein n=1 Tax=hydrothermal vent metagenome TaxID=652676 RepID=A0A3B1CY22_9ZZZZ
MEKQHTEPVDESISLLDLLIVPLKRKKTILIITLATVVITAVISMIMPEIYVAKTRILRPQRQSSAVVSKLLSQFGSAAGTAAGLFGLNSPNALYIALLTSRPVMEAVVKRFDLVKLYGAETVVDASEQLSGNVKVRSSSWSGIISISVYNRNPQLAADIANSLVKELKNMTRRLAITEASQRRVFFGERLKETRESLIKAEKDMADFKAKTGVLALDAQAKAVISAISGMRAKIAEKEVQRKVMRTYSAPNNPELQKLETTLRGLKAELKKLESGKGKGYDYLMSTGGMPEVSIEYIRKLRKLNFTEELYNLFLKQYEAARLDEGRDAVMIQVLEKAIPPEKRIKPKRRRMVMLAALAGFLFSVMLCFLLEHMEKVSGDPAYRVRVERLKKYLWIRSGK